MTLDGIYILLIKVKKLMRLRINYMKIYIKVNCT